MKTICIYHSIDLDGWMSAAIVEHWFNNQIEIPNKEGEEANTLDFSGWNYGNDIPDLSEYDKVIMCDISFPKEEMDKLFNNLLVNFIWIDHHISAIKQNDIELITGIQDTEYAACELTWNFFFPNKKMPEIVRLLGRYDCFGHKGTDEEEKVLIFQYAARAVIKNYEDAYWYLTKWDDESLIPAMMLSGESIYSYLCTEAKQAYKNGFEIKLDERMTGFPNSIEFKTRKFICFNKERFNPINFGIDYHKDGYDGAACFFYQDGQWTFSLYNDNGEVDCSVIAKQFGGGGHKGAAGFRIKNIETILKQVL